MADGEGSSVIERVAVIREAIQARKTRAALNLAQSSAKIAASASENRQTDLIPLRQLLTSLRLEWREHSHEAILPQPVSAMGEPGQIEL